MKGHGLYPSKANFGKENSLYTQSDGSISRFSVPSRLKKVVFFLLVAILLLILSMIAFNSIQYSKYPKSLDEIPLIEADISPIKLEPQDPGGEKFLNQDKLIYRNISDGNIKTSETEKEKALMDEVRAKEDIVLRTPPVTQKANNKNNKDIIKNNSAKKEKTSINKPKNVFDLVH